MSAKPKDDQLSLQGKGKTAELAGLNSTMSFTKSDMSFSLFDNISTSPSGHRQGEKGVEIVLSAQPVSSGEVTKEGWRRVKALVESRLIRLGITDYEVTVNTAAYQVTVRCYGVSDGGSLKETLTATDQLTLVEGSATDIADNTGVTDASDKASAQIILTGADVVSASLITLPASPGQSGSSYAVQLVLSDEGKERFTAAAIRLVGQYISVYVGNTLITSPVVASPITGSTFFFSCGTDYDQARNTADLIRSGMLPVTLEPTGYRILE